MAAFLPPLPRAVLSEFQPRRGRRRCALLIERLVRRVAASAILDDANYLVTRAW